MLPGVIQVEKRHHVPLKNKILNPILFVGLGLAFASILILAVGFNPITVYTNHRKHKGRPAADVLRIERFRCL